MIRLEFEPEKIHNLQFCFGAKFQLLLNKPFGLDGIYITANELEASFAELWEIVTAFAIVHNSSIQIRK